MIDDEMMTRFSQDWDWDDWDDLEGRLDSFFGWDD